MEFANTLRYPVAFPGKARLSAGLRGELTMRSPGWNGTWLRLPRRVTRLVWFKLPNKQPGRNDTTSPSSEYAGSAPLTDGRQFLVGIPLPAKSGSSFPQARERALSLSIPTSGKPANASSESAPDGLEPCAWARQPRGPSPRRPRSGGSSSLDHSRIRGLECGFPRPNEWPPGLSMSHSAGHRVRLLTVQSRLPPVPSELCGGQPQPSTASIRSGEKTERPARRSLLPSPDSSVHSVASFGDPD
jgi:hypothetical protein